MGEVVLLLGGDKMVGVTFFSSRQSFLHGYELCIGLLAPLEVRKEVVVERVETGPRTPPAAPGEPAMVVRLLRVPWLHNGPLELSNSASCRASLLHNRQHHRPLRRENRGDAAEFVVKVGED